MYFDLTCWQQWVFSLLLWLLIYSDVCPGLPEIDPLPPSSVQIPWTRCDSLPCNREPWEHTSEQLSPALCPRQPVQQLALQSNGRGMVTLVISAGVEYSEVVDFHVVMCLCYVLNLCVHCVDFNVQVQSFCRWEVFFKKEHRAKSWIHLYVCVCVDFSEYNFCVQTPEEKNNHCLNVTYNCIILDLFSGVEGSTLWRFSLVSGWSLSTWTSALVKTSGWWWTLLTLLTSCSGLSLFSRPVRTRERRWVEQQTTNNTLAENTGSVCWLNSVLKKKVVLMRLRSVQHFSHMLYYKCEWLLLTCGHRNMY